MSGTPVPEERDTPYEVPFRVVEHQEGDEDPFWHDPTTPGQLPVGEMKVDLFTWKPTEEEVERYRQEVVDRERRRLPFGFRGPAQNAPTRRSRS